MDTEIEQVTDAMSQSALFFLLRLFRNTLMRCSLAQSRIPIALDTGSAAMFDTEQTTQGSHRRSRARIHPTTRRDRILPVVL